MILLSSETGSIGGAIQSYLDHHIINYYPSNIFGFLTVHSWLLLITAALLIFGIPAVVNRIVADGTGGRLGGFFEVIFLFIRDEVVYPFLGQEDGNKYLPIIWTFFFFILTCNLLGLVPKSYTSTGNFWVTGTLAAIAFVFYHMAGIKRHGFGHYVKANLLVGPSFLWPLMIVIELMGHVIRPCALALRLCANMVAGHVMLAVISLFTVLSWIALVPASMGAFALSFLELLVAFIQAFIFTFLTTVFLSMALHPDH